MLQALSVEKPPTRVLRSKNTLLFCSPSLVSVQARVCVLPSNTLCPVRLPVYPTDRTVSCPTSVVNSKNTSTPSVLNQSENLLVVFKLHKHPLFTTCLKRSTSLLSRGLALSVCVQVPNNRELPCFASLLFFV